ncbi:MAG: phosphotyrosine protein phosphatase [Hyphomonadaceae bacterium]|nr:phosphotyrosine protein phosphatase [Hyphomonadaceae bacterium]
MSELAAIHILFVCSMNERRSLTGEALFQREDELSVRSAGTVRGARRTVSDEDILWADLILVMEERHKLRLHARHTEALRDKALHVLAIPDEFPFMDPGLIALLRERAGPLIWPDR